MADFFNPYFGKTQNDFYFLNECNGVVLPHRRFHIKNKPWYQTSNPGKMMKFVFSIPSENCDQGALGVDAGAGSGVSLIP